MSRGWETLDLAEMLARREEATVSGATTSANVGAYERPLGAPLSRYPVGAQDRHTRRRQGADDPYGGYENFDDWMMPSKV
jgi:hypothetical protein